MLNIQNSAHCVIVSSQLYPIYQSNEAWPAVTVDLLVQNDVVELPELCSICSTMFCDTSNARKPAQKVWIINLPHCEQVQGVFGPSLVLPEATLSHCLLNRSAELQALAMTTIECFDCHYNLFDRLGEFCHR